MLFLTKIDNLRLVLFRDAVSGLEEIENGTVVYCDAIVHKVKEDFETVFDMMKGWPGDTDDNGTPVFTPPLPPPLESPQADPGPAKGGVNE